MLIIAAKRIAMAAALMSLATAGLVRTAAADESLALRSFQLGMTIEAFRAAAWPDTMEPAAYPVCSDEAIHTALSFDVTEEDTAAVRCAFFQKDKLFGVTPAKLRIASLSMHVSFTFFLDKDGIYRLMTIRATSENTLYSRVRVALVHKYGLAQSAETVPGECPPDKSCFFTELLTWSNAASRIELAKRDGEAHVMSLTYTNLELKARHEAALDALAKEWAKTL